MPTSGPSTDPAPAPSEPQTTTTTSTSTPLLQSSYIPDAAPPIGDQDVQELASYIRRTSAEPLANDQGPPAEISGDAELGEQPEDEEDTSYWDADAMATLSAQSAAAIARLRAYRPPPFPLWDRLPVSRRAAVLLLLYADRRGDLRVVITMRAASLRSYSGHAAFPGGKADDAIETPYQIARREAFEEIGLPATDDRIPKPFRIEQLCELPCNIAQTEIVVRPCVAFLHVDRDKVKAARVENGTATADAQQNSGTGSSEAAPVRNDGPTVEDAMIPRLDAKEVAAVFSAPFHNFLRANDERHRSGGKSAAASVPGHWYDGRWISFRDTFPWRVHNFYVPVDGQRVQKPSPPPADESKDEDEDPQAKLAEKLAEDEEEGGIARYKVWGMTAHILVDTARLAYAETPEFEHNPHFGDEGIIAELDKEGRFFDKKRKKPEEDGAADGGQEGGEQAKVKKAESAKM